MNQTGCSCHKCKERECPRNVPIFAGLNDAEITKIADLIVRREYKKGEMIVMEGGKLDSLYIINQGKVKSFRYTFEGKEQILYIFNEGDFFGEKNLLGTLNATYNVEALAETHICTIPNKSFQELLKTNPEISFKIIDQLCIRINLLESTIQNMGTKSIDSRVNAVLLEFAEKYGKKEPKGTLVELPVSREGIANYIGIARETVSRKMSSLQEGGIIELIGNKKVLILNMKALMDEA